MKRARCGDRRLHRLLRAEVVVDAVAPRRRERARVVCETEKENSSGNIVCSRAISEPLPTPLGPQITTGRRRSDERSTIVSCVWRRTAGRDGDGGAGPRPRAAAALGEGDLAAQRAREEAGGEAEDRAGAGQHRRQRFARPTQRPRRPIFTARLHGRDATSNANSRARPQCTPRRPARPTRRPSAATAAQRGIAPLRQQRSHGQPRQPQRARARHLPPSQRGAGAAFAEPARPPPRTSSQPPNATSQPQFAPPGAGPMAPAMLVAAAQPMAAARARPPMHGRRAAGGRRVGGGGGVAARRHDAAAALR